MMQKRESQSVSKWHRFRSSKRFIYIVVNLAVFTDAYLYGLIIPVLPFALSEFAGVPSQDLQKWIAILLGAYGAGLIVGSPIAGHLADKSNSRRATYMLGLIALAVSTVMLSVGRSVAVLVVARSIQGASSAFVHCVGVSILSDAVGEEGCGPAMGFVTLWIALGMTAGPICGGLLYHRLGYSAVFVSAYALVGVDVLFRVIMLERCAEHDETSATANSPLLDDRISDSSGPPPQHLTSSYGSIATTTPSSSTNVLTINNPTPTTTTSSSSSFSSSSLTSPSPSQPLPHNYPPSPSRSPSPTLTLLTRPRYLLALHGSFTVSTLLTLLESTLPLHLSRTFHSSAQDIGFILLALSLPAAMSPLVGHLSDRWGARRVMCAGYAGLAVFWVGLGGVGGGGGGYGGGGRIGGDAAAAKTATATALIKAQIALLCVLLVGCGIGSDCVGTPAFIEAKGSADDIALIAEEAAAGGEGGEAGYEAEEAGYEDGEARYDPAEVVVYHQGTPTLAPESDKKKKKKQEGSSSGAKAYGAAFAMMNMAYAAGSMCGPLVGGAVMVGVGWRGLTMGTGVVCAVFAGVRWGVGRRKGKRRSGLEEESG